ncbi:acyl-CoA dehydrogenase [Oleiphilus messinensis]|uniref:3-methylmercaptopropionyl-CoA dehydrogenase n=1 Tax=Oleiphilus messinensis TaxID=141451 RepID=A0A1Y0I7P2_9GAMM|nr:acyl-CoA dehydrogenase C-terminal domain-containing protein [Oleiphilus messinensis]ARU56471.1 acyl-CoA dehydrogenase [Oleiphilus messinensis]
MAEYIAPLQDIQFILHDILNVERLYQTLGKSDLSRDVIDSILEEGGKYASGVVAPLNRNGDEQGAQFQDGHVTTPDGFVDAYRQFCENGWASMTGPEEYDGQGLPLSVAAPFHEMLMSANLSFRVYSGLTEGAVLALKMHGSEALKGQYLAQLVSGHWAGTMCLTEPQAGTDLALLKTKAQPQADGSFTLTGTKIFISGGEQDMSENIIHLVLARLPDAPQGVRGISLFLVPKLLPDDQGNPGDANQLSCGSIEHKMGIKGAATCVMNFDGAKGWLIGEANKGLACMFTMMNDARFQVGLQGIGIAEMAYQGGIAYAKERLQSRSLSGPKNPDLPADPILVQPDVRRMLLTQRALVEGSRMLAYDLACQIDIEHLATDEATRQQAAQRVALLIPIIKAFGTEMSMEVTNLGVQIYGGHGYIREWGMEQLVRDGRITQLYEGTNGIQALDLVRRKLIADKGAALTHLISEIRAWCQTHGNQPDLQAVSVLNKGFPMVDDKAREWLELSEQIIARAADNPEVIGAVCHDYLYYSSYILLAYYWLKMAVTATERLAAQPESRDFYIAKQDTAAFYIERILPRTLMHRAVILAEPDTLLSLSEQQLVR